MSVVPGQEALSGKARRLQMAPNRNNIEFDTDATSPTHRNVPILPMSKIVFACMAVLFVLATLARISPLPAGRAAGGASGKGDFDRTIAPLLAQHCLDCHAGAKPKGGLDLSQQRTLLKGGKSGPAVVPGKLDDSVLWERVSADEMPPKHPLAAADKKKLREWIVAGAAWGDGPIDPLRYTTGKRAGYAWWALRALQRPERATVKIVDWPRNAIDFFVLARLDEPGAGASS